jgi:ABC-2 type transport system permease protein
VPAGALAWQALRNARVSTVSFGALFAFLAYSQPVGYRAGYPTLADRLGLARAFGGNAAARLFYGTPHDLLTISGYAAWRVGGILAIVAAVFGLLAAVRNFRTEEDTGRAEIILAGVVGRRSMYLSAIAAIAAAALVLWAAEFAGFIAAGLPAAGSALLALATTSVVPVCVGVGAVASQLASTRRVALELGGAVVGLLFLLRVVADTSSGLGWLRWATPLGWAENVRPFTGAQPLVLLLPLAASTLLVLTAAKIAARRDIGSGVLPTRDSAAPRLRLLSSPVAQAFRSERGSLIVWALSIAVFSLILGVVSKSISSDGITPSMRREIAKLGSGSIATPTGYLSLVFIFFVLAVSVFVCTQIGAARHEEADQQLETLLAQPISRAHWLGGRLLLATSGAAAISLTAGLATWAGAASEGVSVSLPVMLEAGANCLPVALLFLGIAALVYSVIPRLSAGITYGLIVIAFLWNLTGALLGAPKWVLEATPFSHVGLVPAQAFRADAAATMLGVGVVCALLALRVFRRRDLLGA